MNISLDFEEAIMISLGHQFLIGNKFEYTPYKGLSIDAILPEKQEGGSYKVVVKVFAVADEASTEEFLSVSMDLFDYLFIHRIPFNSSEFDIYLDKNLA